MVPRERHPAIFARLDALKPGGILRLVNDHDPAPLRYQLLAERPDMLNWEPEKQGPEEWVIRMLIHQMPPGMIWRHLVYDLRSSSDERSSLIL